MPVNMNMNDWCNYLNFKEYCEQHLWRINKKLYKIDGMPSSWHYAV